MDLNSLYRVYSKHLKEEFGEKVYKLPVNIPCTCPNRDGTKGIGGCIFCGAVGSGFELLDENLSVTNQLKSNSELIRRKYKANKFIAYFQSFSNTYLDFDRFKNYMTEASQFDGIVEIAISTRPDCISQEQLEFLEQLKKDTGVEITIELGLQSSNNKTLEILNRKHSVEDYIEAAKKIKKHGFKLSTHVIVDLPWDLTEDILELAQLLNEVDTDYVKIHSLYVEKGTKLEQMYRNGLKLLSSEEFINRAILLLENLNPGIIIERLIGRIPEENCVYANWNTSWWKIRDQLIDKMIQTNSYQGKNYKSARRR